jgi:hypothetical protein
MASIPNILNAEQTPETKNLVARELTRMQVVVNGGLETAAVPAFDGIVRELGLLRSVKEVLAAINAHMRRYNFYPAQVVTLANLLVERFAPPMRDPARFVAMGGMPAADDNDVVFVGESTQSEEDKKVQARLDKAAAARTNANKDMRKAQSDLIKANERHAQTTAAREQARALLEVAAQADRAAKADHDLKRTEAEKAVLAIRAAEAEHLAALAEQAELARKNKKARKD